jgi:hypothetical protein
MLYPVQDLYAFYKLNWNHWGEMDTKKSKYYLSIYLERLRKNLKQTPLV